MSSRYAGSGRTGDGRVQFNVDQLAQVDERWGLYSQRKHARSLSPRRTVGVRHTTERLAPGPTRLAGRPLVQPVEWGYTHEHESGH
jgi:hypothetical protein